MTFPLISVVIPAFNEADCVDELASRLKTVVERQSDEFEFEFIIIENGSIDQTYDKLLRLRKKDDRFKIIRLSRNFGIEGALTAGLRAARGDAAIIMCADLQDPPEMIPSFLAKWRAGYQNVYGIIARRTDEGEPRKFFTRRFYWLVNRLSSHPVPENVSDFRLVDCKLYRAFNSLDEKNRMLRTMWGWIGYKSTGIPYTRAPRHGGKSTYSLVKSIPFGLTAIFVATTAPLRLIPIFGLSLSAISFILLLVFIVRWLIGGVPFPGFGTLVSIVLLMFGLLFLFLGLVSEYIGLIFLEVRNRPLYIVSELLGIDPSASRI